MIGIPLLLSTLLLMVGSSSIACVLYVNQDTLRHRLNRLFLAIGCCLLLWGLGLGLRVSAATLPAALAGSHIAPVGYALLFGFLLHYVLLLTGHADFLKRRWPCLLIYLPGVLTAFGLSVLPFFGIFPYLLVRTPLGWVNNTWNFWVFFYYAYYLCFLIAIGFLLWRWARDAASPNTHRQGVFLLVSIVAMSVLGTLTDVLPGLFGIQTPGMAECFAILPILAICHSVKRLGFMRSEEPKSDEIILNTQSREKKIYAVWGRFFLAGGVLSLIIQAVLAGKEGLVGGLVLGGLLLASGFIILSLDRITEDEAIRELLLAMIFSGFIPLITFSSIRYGSLTNWAFLFLLIIPSLLFNRGILLVTVLLSAFQTQLVLMTAAPSAEVRVGAFDYAMRLGLIAAAAGLSLFVSLVYRRRMRENAGHAAQQKTASDLSRILLLADVDNWEETISTALGVCAASLRCERAFFALPSGNTGEIGRICEWPREEASSPKEEEAVRGFLSELQARLKKNEILALSAEEPAAEDMGRAMRALKIQSFMALPVLPDRKERGLLCFLSTRPGYEWGASQAGFLRIVSNMVSDTLMKLESVRKVQYIAYHDQLTGLPNRLLLKDRLNQAMALARRSAKMIGVVFLDLDSFKSVNDTMGHDLGDRLLRQLAAALSNCVRKYDTVARIGGDEFVLLLDQLPSTEALLAAMGKIMDVIRQPVILGGQEFFMTGSAGVAMYPQDGEDAETLISNADIAMYRAKGKGKNSCVLCSQDMKDEIIGQMKMTNLLYRAQEKNQLLIYYQPQVSLATDRISGLEALLRWELPGKGLVSPGVFIPLAEKTGLIQPIGRWVLETACRQNKLWQDRGFAPVRMAVNVSLQQLVSGNFANQVAEALQKTGLSPQWLELEVTESVANSGGPGVSKTFAELKKMGISLSIDDFGTEYSSLNRLKLLPVDRLKLDIQFVRGIESSEKDRAITKTIISLAKNLNMKVIAEGVETEEELAFLSQRLCDEVQGFYYYKPMPAAELEPHLRRGKEET